MWILFLKVNGVVENYRLQPQEVLLKKYNSLCKKTQTEGLISLNFEFLVSCLKDLNRKILHRRCKMCFVALYKTTQDNSGTLYCILHILEFRSYVVKNKINMTKGTVILISGLVTILNFINFSRFCLKIRRRVWRI